MYRIGEFSLLKSVSIKTLRYYDSIDLFKPEVVDEFSGYRYYSENQLNEFDLITTYKYLGFSLEQIKMLISNDNSNDLIHNQINELTSQIINNKKRISKLTNMLEGNKMRVQYKPFEEEYKIGKKFTISSRDEIEIKLKEIKKELLEKNVSIIDPVFCNFELGYEEENIDCFIGFTIKEINKIDGFTLIGKSMNIKYLVGEGEQSDVSNLYQDMIKFSKENNIQIRGYYSEIYYDNKVTVYVEAFDLNIINEDQIQYLSNYKPSSEIEKELIGTYKIREILPDIKYMANPNKQKSMLDTKYKILELNSDGSTNYDNIKWNSKELVLRYDEKNIPLPIMKINYLKKTYINILMNETLDNYLSQRPLNYLYEKIK